MDRCEYCKGTKLIWEEDEDRWITCDQCLGEDDEESEDELLDNKELFPDELPENLKNKWDD